MGTDWPQNIDRNLITNTKKPLDWPWPGIGTNTEQEFIKKFPGTTGPAPVVTARHKSDKKSSTKVRGLREPANR